MDTTEIEWNQMAAKHAQINHFVNLEFLIACKQRQRGTMCDKSLSAAEIKPSWSCYRAKHAYLGNLSFPEADPFSNDCCNKNVEHDEGVCRLDSNCWKAHNKNSLDCGW